MTLVRFAETIQDCYGHASANISALFRLIVHPFSCFYLPCRKMQLYTKLSKSLTALVGIQIFKLLNRKPIYKSALHRGFARHKQRLTPPVGVASRSRLACQTWFSHSLFSLSHARRFTGRHTPKHKPHRRVQRLDIKLKSQHFLNRRSRKSFKNMYRKRIVQFLQIHVQL